MQYLAFARLRVWYGKCGPLSFSGYVYERFQAPGGSDSAYAEKRRFFFLQDTFSTKVGPLQSLLSRYRYGWNQGAKRLRDEEV